MSDRLWLAWVSLLRAARPSGMKKALAGHNRLDRHALDLRGQAAIRNGRRMSAGGRFKPGDRVRVVNPDYGTFDQTGAVTEPDEFWRFGPCVLLDGQDQPGAFLDDDLELLSDLAVPEHLPAARASSRAGARRDTVALDPFAEADHRDEASYRDGLREGWSQAVRHIADRLQIEGGTPGDPATIAPEVSELIAGIVARVEIAEGRVLTPGSVLDGEDRDRTTLVLPSETAGALPGFSTNTLTMLIEWIEGDGAQRAAA